MKYLYCKDNSIYHRGNSEPVEPDLAAPSAPRSALLRGRKTLRVPARSALAYSAQGARTCLRLTLESKTIKREM